jgi:hypothetical protein
VLLAFIGPPRYCADDSTSDWTPTAEDVITHVLPAFNGLYRSFTSTPHSFTLPSFLLLSSSLAAFLTSAKVEHLNGLLHRPTQSPGASAAIKRQQNANALLGRYRSNGRPLSGNFLVCASQENPADPDGEDGAEASNLAWDLLLRGEAAQQPTSSPEGELVRIKETAERAMGVFEGMLANAIQLKAEANGTDLYLFEVMSESLVRCRGSCRQPGAATDATALLGGSVSLRSAQSFSAGHSRRCSRASSCSCRSTRPSTSLCSRSPHSSASSSSFTSQSALTFASYVAC